ncbi:hypothetical protein K4H04_20650, partial [Mycobacterium tuberculosis]|nr:hypothetical protein [Mycobacterium tuberculosis]
MQLHQQKGMISLSPPTICNSAKLINLPHLADMVFGVPHYVTRQTMDSVKAVLIPRIQGITEDTVI